MAVELIPDEDMRDLVAHLPGVVAAVYDEAQEGGRRSNARLQAARASGVDKISGPEHVTKVTVTRGDVDSFVNLEGTNAMAIEFGHDPSGYFDPERYGRLTTAPRGLYIITIGTGAVGGG